MIKSDDIVDLIKQANSIIPAALAIGSANKRYIACICDGGNLHTYYYVLIRFGNLGANDFNLIFTVPLPTTIGNLKLYIDRIRVGIADADADDYLNHLYLDIHTAYNTFSNKYNNATDRIIGGEYDYDPPTAIDCSTAKRVQIRLSIISTTAGQFALSYLQVRYYYDN